MRRGLSLVGILVLAAGARAQDTRTVVEPRLPTTLDGVQLTDQAEYKYSLNHADLRLGPGATNLQLPAGMD